jgi:hypothetical protein
MENHRTRKSDLKHRKSHKNVPRLKQPTNKTCNQPNKSNPNKRRSQPTKEELPEPCHTICKEIQLTNPHWITCQHQLTAWKTIPYSSCSFKLINQMYLAKPYKFDFKTLLIFHGFLYPPSNYWKKKSGVTKSIWVDQPYNVGIVTCSKQIQQANNENSTTMNHQIECSAKKW